MLAAYPSNLTLLLLRICKDEVDSFSCDLRLKGSTWRLPHINKGSHISPVIHGMQTHATLACLRIAVRLPQSKTTLLQSFYSSSSPRILTVKSPVKHYSSLARESTHSEANKIQLSRFNSRWRNESEKTTRNTWTHMMAELATTVTTWRHLCPLGPWTDRGMVTKLQFCWWCCC
jgi:hypothetical protein